MNPPSLNSLCERLPVGIDCMDAYASLEQLSSTSGGPYSVQRAKVIMELYVWVKQVHACTDICVMYNYVLWYI